MKDLEWLKEEVEIDIDNLWFKSKLDTDSTESLISRVNHLIDQLDEPEVLSQEWIDRNKEPFHHFETKKVDYYVSTDFLQNLLVPKQDEVKRAQIPEWIIEWYQGANNELSTLEDVFSNLSHDTNYNIMDSEKFRSRIMEYGGFSRMYEALSHIYFGVYEIEEEEQKYEVRCKGELLLTYYTNIEEVVSMNRWDNHLSKRAGRDWKLRHQLTEQEIKDYDERFWPFAEEVTE